MFLSLRSGLSVISRGVIAGAQQSYNRILKLFPTVSSQAPASTRPVQQGQVCEFDGVNDYIDCGNSTSFDFPDLINIQFYLKLNDTGFHNFISKGIGSTTNYSVDYAGGLRVFGYDSGSPVGSLGGYTLSTGQWYHIQCIKDATHFRIFVDGIEVTATASTATLTTNSNSLLIGKRETRHCDGYMSGVIISDVAQYNLNHASGTTAYDSSGNGNDGTLQNGAAFVVDNTLPPEADKLNLEGYSKRMFFDGVDDEVELNVSPNELVETGVFDMSVEIVWDSSKIASYGRFLWFMTAGGFFRLQRDSNTSTFRLWARQGAGLDIIPKTGFVISADTNHVIRLVGNGVNCMIYLDGSLINTVTMNTANFHTPTWSKVSLGEASSSQFKGTIYNWSLITASITQQLNGYGNTDADWTDQSGNGNDGTVNGSPENLLLPRDESDPTNDIFDNPLQYSGSVYPRRPEFRNSYAAGNMMFQYSNTHTHASNTTTVYEVRMKRTTGTTYLFSGDVATNSWFRLTDTEAEGYLFATFTDENLSENLPQNVWIDIKVTIDEGTNNVTVEYKLIENSSYIEILDVTWAIASSFVWGFSGRKNTSVDIGGDVLSYKVTQDATVLMDLQFTNGAGDTIFDVGPAKNHATVLNGTTATEGLGSYDGRIDGEDNALNNNNGFTNGLRVATIGNYGGAVHDIEFTINTTDSQFVLGNDSGTKLLLAVHDGSSSVGLFDASSVTVDGVTLTSTTRDDLHTAICDGQTHTVLVSDCNLTSWANLMIGSYASSVSAWLFDGVVTKIKIDGAEVTPTEITSRIRIPADTSDPTKDVLGNTLTNPAITDGYNDAETELDAYNIAESDNPSPATNNNSDLDAIEFGEDLSSNDAAFMRLTSSTQNDRLITFEDDLTGDDKELVEKFTETP